MRSTHTFAVLEISKAAFDEIAQKLRSAGYDHAFVEEFIDMHGLALAAETKKVEPPAPLLTVATSPDGYTYFDFRDVHAQRPFADDVQRDNLSGTARDLSPEMLGELRDAMREGRDVFLPGWPVE